MALSELARTYTINALGSIGTRYVISEAAGLAKKQALVFNGVDMLLNTMTGFIFNKYSKSLSKSPYVVALLNVWAPREISLIAAACITSYTVGRIDLGAASSLTMSSLCIGVVLRLAESSFFKTPEPNLTIFM